MRQEEELLKRASMQIKQLQQQNALMGARLNMFDQVVQLVNVNKRGGGDMCCSTNDIGYEIDRFLEWRDGESKKGTSEKSNCDELKAKVRETP
jgi:hypothetical protein